MQSLDGGFVAYSTLHNANGNFRTDTEVHFTCLEEGTGLDGPTTLLCVSSPSNDDWDHAAPTCER